MKSELKGIGEIVSWTSPKSIDIDTLRDGMLRAGLDPDTAKDMKPANAFRRAIHDLEDNRVIRQTLNADDKIHFQFTSEILNGGEFHYNKEADLTVDKNNGVVECNSWELQARAQTLLNEQVKTRSASDVTRIIKRLFEDGGDMFPLRDAGGVYFVPEVHTAICDCMEILMTAIGGNFRRWEMNSSPRNNKNAAVAIRDAIQGMIADYAKYAETLSSDDTKVLAKGMKKIQVIRTKLNAYRDVLSGYESDIEKTLATVTVDLQAFASGDEATAVSSDATDLGNKAITDPTPDDDATSAVDNVMSMFA
jgi:hypothetical protein